MNITDDSDDIQDLDALNFEPNDGTDLDTWIPFGENMYMSWAEHLDLHNTTY